MKRVHVVVFAVLAACAIGGVALTLGLAARVTLIADGPVPVYDRAASDPAQTQVISTLEAGDELVVSGCVDLKHYIVPEVELRDGKKGYVIEGAFHLRRAPLLSSSGGPIAFGC